ncbi:MAG: PSD1 and planctomycete cytochrome C domain-containing protein [Pirellulales bacterium]
MIVIIRLFPLLLLLIMAATGSAAQLTDEEVQFFETKIRPVLVKECYGCHSNQAGNVRGGLRLDTKELTHIGGSSGPAVVPGSLDDSWLYNAITHQDFVMPPKRSLSQDIIDDFRTWIEMGAPDPRVNTIAQIRPSITQDDIQRVKESFWAYAQPVKNDVPAVVRGGWPKTEIDRFILAKLEHADLQPARDTATRKVLRRLSFDLVGLPPSPEQIKSFTTMWKNDPEMAIANEVNRLLETKQFGERWGRHWLDVVRYAESTGREVNMTYPHAWRYRDYVIDSFNDDKPFDQFVREQIAGDLLPAKSTQKWAENLVATTFLAIGPKNVNEPNRVQFAADVVDEQIDATTRIFLGQSVACARCHDHKFDPIPQTDYYALAGVFSNLTTYFGNPPSAYGNFSSPQTKQNSSLIVFPLDDPSPFDPRYSRRELANLRDEMTDKLQAMAELRRNRNQSNNGSKKNAQRNRIRTINELVTLSGKLAVVDEEGNPRSYCMGVQERGKNTNVRLLARGEIDQPAQLVERGFPQVLCSSPVTIDDRSSGRLELARWIANEDNPLTARVMVNRIWQHMMGQAIVTSTENFGTSGQPPSHPKLLDYLALRFMESGWSVKGLIRDIATSRVYRIRSTFNRRYHESDPDNRLVWRANPRRLDAEAIRDAMLSISGEIDFHRPRGSEVAKAGYTRVRGGILGNPRDIAKKAFALAANNSSALSGERVVGRRSDRAMRRSHIDSAKRKVAYQVTHQLDMENAKFRSVFLPIIRDQEPRSLEVFDGADSSVIIGKREVSNTANQALYMMNNRFVIQQSDSFASRVAAMSTRRDEQIEYAFLLAYGRLPTHGERAATTSLVRAISPSKDHYSRNHATLRILCQGLFASAEFRYLD